MKIFMCDDILLRCERERERERKTIVNNSNAAAVVERRHFLCCFCVVCEFLSLTNKKSREQTRGACVRRVF